jgi:hypothetical protein
MDRAAPGRNLAVRSRQHAGAYDPLNDRLIVFGGYSGTAFLSDTQFLTWGVPSSEALLTGSGSATPTAAHLEWDVDAATGTHAAVYRKASGGEWTALAEAEVDGSGNAVFDDATVAAGQDYEYMMVVASQRGETFGGVTSVEVPTTLDAGRARRTSGCIGSCRTLWRTTWWSRCRCRPPTPRRWI